jgi:hypothetical protein
VHEACKNQKIITRNTTEAELVALSDYMREGQHLSLMPLRNIKTLVTATEWEPFYNKE